LRWLIDEYETKKEGIKTAPELMVFGITPKIKTGIF